MAPATMAPSGPDSAWCIYVSFLECSEIGQVKVPCKPHDTIRHLIIKAKERAKMMAPETLNTAVIDATDALVELNGAVLFQGDSVSEVLANGDHVKAISPTLSRDQVETELARTAKSGRSKVSAKERASRAKSTKHRDRTPSTSPEDSISSRQGSERGSSRHYASLGASEPAAGSLNYKAWQTRGDDSLHSDESPDAKTGGRGGGATPAQASHSGAHTPLKSSIRRGGGNDSVAFSVTMTPATGALHSTSGWKEDGGTPAAPPAMTPGAHSSLTPGATGTTTTPVTALVRETLQQSQAQMSVRQRYKEIRRLKGGVKTIVYLAHDTACASFYREVVVKLLPGNAPGDLLYRWKKEMRTVASLRHPGIVTFFDIGEEADGSQFVVMEVVPGSDLQQILDSQGFLSEEQTATIAIGILHALVTAHAAGVLHRDIKPANIMVVLSTLSVKVIDFGLAKQLDNASLISRMYTPMYFSPEQTIMGAEVGPQSDVWAVGVLIFHCMTGTLPFGRLGDSIEVIVHEIRSKGVPNIIAASQQRASLFLREVVEGALKKNLDDRTASAAAMLSQLEGALRAGLSKFASSVAAGDGGDISQSGLAAMVRAGRGPGSAGGGSLLRVKELQEQLERSQREIAVKKDEIEALTAQVKVKTQQMETLSSRLNELSDELPQSKKQLNVQRDHLAVSQHELRAKADELEHAQRELGIKSEELDRVQRLLNSKTADMITAEKKLMDRNEKIHKLFRQLSGQRDDYENKLQDLQQVCDDYEAEMEDLRQTMDEFFNSQEDWIHRDQLKALTDTIQRLQADGQRLDMRSGGGARNASVSRGSKGMGMGSGYDHFEGEEEEWSDDDDYAYDNTRGPSGAGARETGGGAAAGGGYLQDDQSGRARPKIEDRDRDRPRGDDAFYQHPSKGAGKEGASKSLSVSERNSYDSYDDRSVSQGSYTESDFSTDGFYLPAEEVYEIFAALDANGDGEITHAEFIKGLKTNPLVAAKLGMPSNIRQEDGTRESYQLAFGKMDNDNSKSIDVNELLRFCGHKKRSRASHSATPSRKNTPQRSPAPGKPADAKARRLSFKEITEIFKILDKNGDGSITHAEFIVGLKKNAWVAEKLGMPSHVRQEDGTRESYQLSFGKIDNDNSKSIEFKELCGFFGYYEDGDLMSDWSQQSMGATPAASGNATPRGTGGSGMDSASSYHSYISGNSGSSRTRQGEHHAKPKMPAPAQGSAGGLGKKHDLSALEVINIFKTLDINGDGEVSHAEFLKGLKANPTIAEKLGMPTDVRAEDGTRDTYQLAFGNIDNDGSKTIDLTELLEFYGHLGLEKSNLTNLLMLCGYNADAIRDIFGRAGLMSASVSSLSSMTEHEIDHDWQGVNAVSQVSREQRRAEMLRKKKREHFLRRMADEAERSLSSRPHSASSRHSTGTGNAGYDSATGTGAHTPAYAADHGDSASRRDREKQRMEERTPSAASLLNNPEKWLSSTEQRLKEKGRAEPARLSMVGEEKAPRPGSGSDRLSSGGVVMPSRERASDSGGVGAGMADRKSSAGLRQTERAMPSKDEQEADLIFDEAAAHWENGEYSQAEAKYKHALRLDPNHVLTLCSYGVLLYDVRRDHESAEKMYKRALNLDPQNVNTLCNYGWLLHDVRRDHDAAEQLYKQALRLDPNHVMTLCNYGALLHEYLHDIKGDLVDVEHMYQKALRIDPNHIDTLNNYGLLLHKTKHDYDGAEEMYRRVLRLDNNQVDTLCSYALLLKDVRMDMPHAKQLVRRAQSLDPQHPWLQQNAEAFAHFAH